MAYDPYRPNIPSQGILSVRDLYNFYSNNPTIRGEEETVTPTPISVDPIVPNRFSYFNDDDEDYLDFNPDITGGTFLSNYATNYLNNPEGTIYNLPLDVSRKGTTLSNFNPLNSYQNLNPYTKVGVNFAANALIPGSGTLFGLANLANDYYNPPRDPYGGLIDFNKQPDYDFGPDGDGVAFGENEVSVQDAIDAGFGNVRGPDDDLTLKEKMEYEGTDGGGEPGGGYDSESETDSGSGTHSDPGD